MKRILPIRPPDGDARMDAANHRLRIELIAWATRFVGGDGSERAVFEEEVRPSDTVRSVLKRFSARHPDLDGALWDQDSAELGGHLEVVVNDAVLGINHTLGSEVKEGDSILLMGQYMGG